MAIGAEFESVHPSVDDPQVHHFGSTLDAYSATQCNDGIRDGDVLVIEAEGVVGILHQAWPIALTAEHGELQTLTAPASGIDGGRYLGSTRTAARVAAEHGFKLAPLHAPSERYSEGDRIVCADGATRTVEDTYRDCEGHLWLRTEGGAAWRANRCERVDLSRVDEARGAARRAALALHGSNPSASGEFGAAVRDLGEALRYLAQAAPDVLKELAAEHTHRIAVEVPRLGVVPGDILHAYGVRLHVLDTGVQSDDHGAPRWWADVHGVHERDRRLTYRAPWRMSLRVEDAAWDLLTVERLAPVQPF